MRWILLLLIACVFSLAGCGDDRGNGNNKLDGKTDTGFDLAEDADSHADAAADAATDVDDKSDVADQDVDPTEDTNPKEDTGPDPTTCTTSAECTGSRPVCDPMSGLCVDCLFDSQCTDGGRCIDRECKTEGTCQSDRDCADVPGKAVCNQGLRTCVAACNNSLDCTRGDVCDPIQKQCVQCATNLDCGDGQRCIDSQCEEFLACQSDNQCTPHGLLCDVDRGACNECENDAGCPDAYNCTAGRCVVDVCANGAMRCTGRSIEKCVDGKHFEIVQSCQLPEVCRQEANAASCGACTANAQCAVGSECKAGVCKLPEGQTCPTAVAEVRLADTTDYTDELHAKPLQNIEFNASRSSGDGTLTYEWTIIKRPLNSQARLTPNATSAKPGLWIDLAGDYEIELAVFDANGIESCDRSLVKIHAVPGDEIHIQLTWSAPAVPNPSEANGTDMDLHYRHQNGTKWNDKTYTVFWDNKHSSSSWGSTPTLANTATMDIDDLTGATTENINHIQPLNGSYEVGIHYYSDNGHGGADANLRVYIRGVLKYEVLNKRMQHKQFWRVGSLSWPSTDMIWVDQVICDTTLAGFAVSGCRP